MKSLTSPSWHSVAVNRNPGGVRLARDGEVPLIRYANSGIASIVKCRKSALAILAATFFAMPGATAQRESPAPASYVNDVLVARCKAGDLHVMETVDTNTGARGGVFATFDFVLVDERVKTPKRIDVTFDGSYKLPTASDRLAIFRSPQARDLHLFAPPRLFGSDEYKSLVNCIAQNMATIYDKMAISRPPHKEFPSRDRFLPPIATMRYSDVSDIEKRYQCGAGVRIDVYPSGGVWLRRHQADGSSTGHLVGAILDDATTIGVEESDQVLRAIPSLPEFFARCKTTAGTSLVPEFNVQVMKGDSVLKAIGRVYKRAAMIGSVPNVTLTPSIE